MPACRSFCPKTFAFTLLLSLALNAAADYTTDQIQMAANGRFDLLEQSLEERASHGTLGTMDQHALCYAYSKTKRYSQLTSCLDQLEDKFKKGSKRTRLFGLEDGTATVPIMRAEAYIEMGQYKLAVVEAERALRWLEADDSEDLDLLFNAIAAQSLAHALNGDHAKAKELEQKLVRLTPTFGTPYRSAHAMALARTRMGLKDYHGVIDSVQGDKIFGINVFLDRLITGSFFTGVNNWVWVELPRAFMLNKALLETGQVAQAQVGLDKLLSLPQVKENGEIYWLMLNDRGRIADEQGQLQDALDYYRKAIEVVETQRASINTEASKIGFVDDKQNLYSRAIDVARRLDRNDLAYEYIERSKSRALVDLLAERDSKGVAFSAKNMTAKRLLDEYRSAKEKGGLQLPVDMAKAGGNTRNLAIVSTGQELQKASPELASLVTVNAISFQQARQYIRPDEALLEFFGTNTAFFGIAISDKGTTVERLDVTRLEKDIRKFRAQIEDGNADPALAMSLYQQLIKPFERIIGQHNLVLVPHGPLHYLPFASLNDGKDVLIGRRNLRTLPSLTVQRYIEPRRTKQLDDMLIFGNPDLGSADMDLPGAEVEAKMISGLVRKSEVLSRTKASESHFKRFAGAVNYLHVASHGQFNSDNPLDSRLLLAPDGENDGSLTVRELYDLHLQADLITLSACETGLGKAMSGDDLVGLTRGFLYAGSSNIVASLWQVDDEATAELMRDFYVKLKSGIDKKEALRLAQLDLRKKRPEPRYWAAFYLTGEGL
jgi:CHAT domain-containing protein